MSLEATLALQRDEFQLQVDLTLPLSGITCLFGPSGSGKTTVLRCLAGLTRARGRVVCGDQTWQDDAAARWVPPHERGVGVVFQEAALFPHLSVAGNLSYAEDRAPADGGPTRADVVAAVGLEPLLSRDPATLSGGERQRVAIGRALLARPRLLLLDEPVAALDVAARAEVLTCVQAVRRRFAIPMVYVSHAPAEVARLADHLVWLDAGSVRASEAGARLLGRLDLGAELGDEAVSVIEATVREHDEAHHLTALDAPWGTLWVRRLEHEPGEAVRARVWARDVSIDLDPPGRSSALNVLRLEVLDLRDEGPGSVLVRLGGAPAEEPKGILARITARSRDALGIVAGQQVHARIKSISLR